MNNVKTLNMRLRRRFHANVRYIRRKPGCWVWNGKKDRKGYGAMKVEGRRVNARRLSWILHYGPIPEGMGVYRWCLKHKDCVNPNHLYIAKPKEQLDMYYLQLDGKEHLAKIIPLDKEKVAQLKAAHQSGTMTKRQLCSNFKVNMRQVELLTNPRRSYTPQYWFEPGWSGK